MEYLFMDNLELAKENFIKCLEEDIEDQSALYNVVYCFEFLDQNQEAIDYLNKYIRSKSILRNRLAPSWALVIWSKKIRRCYSGF